MKVIARILVGSQNYGLDIPNSDKDYKVLLCPEFEDLYNYRKVEAKDLPKELDKEHYSVMSVITFDKHLRNGNPNCLEMLYSVDLETDNTDFCAYVDYAVDLLRDGYLAVVWESFYNAVAGIIMNGFDKYGATRKTVSRAEYFYRMICALPNQNEHVQPYGMTAYTWRNREIVSGAKRLRTDESIKQEELEEIKDAVIFLLKDEKLERYLKAQRWIEKNKEKADLLKWRAKCLGEAMKNLVYDMITRD